MAAITAAFSSYRSVKVSSRMKSAPASVPARMTSANTSTASSKGRSPAGWSTRPQGPMSSAAYRPGAPPMAFLAVFTPAATIFASSIPAFSALKRLAPKVFARMTSAPAARYSLCIDSIASGAVTFSVSGTVPSSSPRRWSIVPIAPSNNKILSSSITAVSSSLSVRAVVGGGAGRAAPVSFLRPVGDADHGRH